MSEAVRCACAKGCACTVLPGQGVVVDGKVYCSEACAHNHVNGKGCGSSDCHCGV
ncbi:MAG: metallothionein [Oscillatoriales cyanobacterium SM2_1_8]|nr:metallothionein [Oscillatoriales cyanobacterium SM2_1_8]